MSKSSRATAIALAASAAVLSGSAADGLAAPAGSFPLTGLLSAGLTAS